MKRVELINITKETVLLADQRDHYQPSAASQINRIADSCGEIAIDASIDIKNIKIKKLCQVNQGVTSERYVAVHPDVWEDLHMIKQEEINELERELKESKDRLNYESVLLKENKEINKQLINATLLQRIEWVFTGVKV